jgi:hypothetical protein
MSTNTRTGNTLLESGFFAPCRLATTGANVALSGLAAIDGVVPIEGDRILVKDQADPTTNGIYAAASGNWVRTTDAAGNAQFFDGMAVIVAQGATNASLTFLCTTADDPVVVGTSLLTFASQQAVANALAQATSTTSAALTTGAKTFAIQAGKNFSAKQWLLIYETSNPDNNLLAEITSYSGTTLVVNVAATAGAGGPFTDWTIVLTNTPAAAGRQPPIGTGNVTGPGSAVDGNVALFDGTTGKLIKDSGKQLGTLASRAALLYGDAGAKTIPAAALADGAAPLPFVAAQTADNLALSNDGTNPNSDIQITAGRVRDDSDATNLQLAATMLKRIDTAWAAGGLVGTRKGMLLAGSSWLASKTYHLWLIGALGLAVTQFARTANVATLTITAHPLGVGGTIRVLGVGSGFDGVAAITATGANTGSYANTGADVGATAAAATADGFDIGATQQDAQGYPAATLPAGFTVKQCLGSITTDGSKNVIAFVQIGDRFLLKSSVAVDLSGLAILPVPVGVSVEAELNARLTTTGPNGSCNIFSPLRNAPGATAMLFSTSGIIYAIMARAFTDTSARVEFDLVNATVTVCTLGWRDPRRRLF